MLRGRKDVTQLVISSMGVDRGRRYMRCPPHVQDTVPCRPRITAATYDNICNQDSVVKTFDLNLLRDF